MMLHVAQLRFAVRAGDGPAQIERQGHLLVHVDARWRRPQRRGVAGFLARRLAVLALGDGGLDEGWRRRRSFGFELLAQLRHLPAQRCILFDGTLVFLLELGQLPAVIFALGQLLPQKFVLLAQALNLSPEKIVALKQASAIHDACSLIPQRRWRDQRKATGR